MKKIFVSATLLAVMMIGLSAISFAQAKEAANFAGTWALDKAKSEGLPPMMANAEGVTWVVTQDGGQLTREQKVEGAPAPPAGGPGGGGGGRGGGMGGGAPMTVKLDGSESVTDVPRISGKSTTKVKWMDGGKMLEVSTVMSGSMGGNDFTATTTEHWELADGGKTLKVHRTSESPRGTQESKMVFTKK
ncbi:MAG: hypothetical protein IPG76_03610 [Acidobacteria bacterium]|nr:hypothetical protein [Acidobacteriota bacterium]